MSDCVLEFLIMWVLGCLAGAYATTVLSTIVFTLLMVAILYRIHRKTEKGL